MNIIAPCKDCPDRTAHCHAKCDKYNAWKSRREKLLKKNRQDKELDGALIELAQQWKKS